MARKDRSSRLGQIRAAYSMTRQSDPRIGLVLLGVVLASVVVFALVGLLIHQLPFMIFLGVLSGITAATFVFGRRAEGAAYRQIEGQPGAAAAVLDTLRKGWTVTPAVAVSRQQDVVHRVVGRAGVVLVGEGSSGSRVGQLLASERKKTSRVVPDIPVHEVIAGNGTGEVSLRRLNRHVMKFPGTLAKTDVTEVNRRLKAVGSMSLPMPKGPIPKGAKVPRMPRGMR